MNKKTKIVIAVLVLMNLVLATFLYLGKPKHKGHNSPIKVIIEKLGLDESQQKALEILVSNHQKEVRGLQKQIASQKTVLYQELSHNNSVFNDSLGSIIANKFKEMEEVQYNHFLEIKKLCRKDQEEKFKELTNQFQKIFRPGKRGRKR